MQKITMVKLMFFPGKKMKIENLILATPLFSHKIKCMYIVSKIKINWLVLMYNGGFTSLKHKNYVEGKKKYIWLLWKPILETTPHLNFFKPLFFSETNI